MYYQRKLMKVVLNICVFLSLNGTLLSMDEHQKKLSLVTKEERCTIINYLQEQAKRSDLSEKEGNDFLESAEQVQRSIIFDVHKADYSYVMDELWMRSFLAGFNRDSKRCIGSKIE
jgi:hypothetical protein